MRSLPLRSCLVLATVCKEFGDLVRRDILRGITELDLNNFFGAKVTEGITWACHADLPGLRGISASGHACLDALMAACTLPVGQARLSQLTSLHLDTLKQLQDKHLQVLLPRCPNLEVLALPRCVKLADSAAALVGAHLPRLRVLCCHDWTGLTDAGMCVVAGGCSQLEDITLDGCLRVGSESLAVLARSCPRLRRVSIAKSYGVTDSALAAFGEWCNGGAGGGAGESETDGSGQGRGGGALQELSLRQCPRLTDVRLLRRCTNLTSLDFSGCPRIDSAGLAGLLSGCGRSLASLQLNGCVGVTGESLAALGGLCPNLRALHLRGLALQDAHLVELARSCTSLRTLGLAWCTRITDQGLTALVAANPQLQDLDMEALYLVTDSLLGTLADRSPLLSRLCIRMCHRLSPDAIVELVKALEVRMLLLSGILDDAGTSELAARIRRAQPQCALHW